MPYIKADRRHDVNNWLQVVWARIDGDLPLPGDTLSALPAELGPQDCGELNYALTMTCIRHDRIKFGGLDDKLRLICDWFATAAPLRYQRINDIVGACECAALELERRRPGAKKFEAVTLRYIAQYVYRHIGIAYEIQKIAENGDIDYGEKS